jgi:hypothetical protein
MYVIPLPAILIALLLAVAAVAAFQAWGRSKPPAD